MGNIPSVRLWNLSFKTTQPEFQPTALSQLKYAEPTELYLRDGEVVIHCRPRRKTLAAELFK
jgi:hypothetical protein